MKYHIKSRIRTVCGLKLTDDRALVEVDYQTNCENCLRRLVQDSKRVEEIIKELRKLQKWEPKPPPFTSL